MPSAINEQHWDTLVIGAGQAGLATGYYLSQLNKPFMILDAGERIGDTWRSRWDSLRLFTPAQYDGLPGMPFPAAKGYFPTKDQMADYLAAYSTHFELPVTHGVQVAALEKRGQQFQLSTPIGDLTANQVVVATGTHAVPRVPSFAQALTPDIFQVHTAAYRNPTMLPPGDVLVVGAGESGVQLALELATGRHVYLAGKPTAHIPDPVFRYASRPFWWFASHVLTTATPIGRKVRQRLTHGGAPLIGVSVKDLDTAHVERVPRVIGAQNGLPELEDGRVLPVSAVVWATGYRPDLTWIRPPVTDQSGLPHTTRGVSGDVAGLYFVGLLFQYSLSSGFVGGVGRDAAYVVQQLNGKGSRGRA